MKKTRENDQMMLAGTEEGEILAKLNDRVERAISTIQELRRERETLQKRVSELELKVQDHGANQERLSTLEEDYERFGRERTEIRSRIETILSSLEELDSAEEPPEE